jgi:hypothetical protein
VVSMGRRGVPPLLCTVTTVPAYVTCQCAVGAAPRTATPRPAGRSVPPKSMA